jgi:hypothetical protein
MVGEFIILIHREGDYDDLSVTLQFVCVCVCMCVCVCVCAH